LIKPYIVDVCGLVMSRPNEMHADVLTFQKLSRSS